MTKTLAPITQIRTELAEISPAFAWSDGQVRNEILRLHKLGQLDKYISLSKQEIELELENIKELCI